MSKTWVPSASDIKWTETLLRNMKDGGLWLVPMNNSGYRINHSNKTVSVEFGPLDGTYMRIRHVLEHLGYAVHVNKSDVEDVSSIEDYM